MFYINNHAACAALSDANVSSKLSDGEFNEAIIRTISDNSVFFELIGALSPHHNIETRVLKELKKVIFNHRPSYLAKAIVDEKFSKLFTQKEIEKAINICITSAAASEILLKHSDIVKLSPEQRLKAINLIVFNPLHADTLFTETKGRKRLTDEEKLYIISKLGNDKEYNRVYIEKIFKSIIKSHKSNSKLTNGDRHVRDIVFSLLVEDKYIMIKRMLEIGDYLTISEKDTIYNLYQKDMYRKFSRAKDKNDYIRYCLIFSHCLNITEQKMLIKKLTEYGNVHLIKKVIDNVTIIDELKDELVSIIIVNNLTKN